MNYHNNVFLKKVIPLDASNEKIFSVAWIEISLLFKLLVCTCVVLGIARATCRGTEGKFEFDDAIISECKMVSQGHGRLQPINSNTFSNFIWLRKEIKI